MVRTYTCTYTCPMVHCVYSPMDRTIACLLACLRSVDHATNGSMVVALACWLAGRLAGEQGTHKTTRAATRRTSSTFRSANAQQLVGRRSVPASRPLFGCFRASAALRWLACGCPSARKGARRPTRTG